MNAREAEIHRLQGLAERIRTEMRTNERARQKNNDRGREWDMSLDERLYRVNERLGENLRQVDEMLFDVQSNVDWRPPAPKQAQQKAAPRPRDWEINQSDLVKPNFPATGDEEVFDKAYSKFQDHWVAQMQNLARKAGVSPDVPVTFESLASIVGEAFGMIKFGELRMRDLEDRVDAVEAAGLKYCGVHQKALPYKKGSVVTYSGSAWIALKDVPEGVPPIDDNNYWQLAVKRGSDGHFADPGRAKKEQSR